ncbi:cobinamide adenolsyltransferase [Clostridiales bacterium PH28_bin88]|nr:cobinamide adenolsyltransferase [Clostridiales bacterium PH28_bin88]
MYNVNRRGLIQVYTGNGKGKTTAAIGQAVRALGHGYKVFMLQFMKGSKNYGELRAAEKFLPGLTIVQSGRHEFVDKQNPEPVDVRMAREGLALAQEAIMSDKYDMVILDEINVALDFGLIPLDEVLALLNAKPSHIDLILTGRYAPEAIMRLADLISEIREGKHHYRDGVQAREGIEY